MVPRVGEALGAVALGHAVFTGLGLANSIAAKPPPRPEKSLAKAVTPRLAKMHTVIDASAAVEAHVVAATSMTSAVATAVRNMYAGYGVDASLLAPDATVTDPAASCRGRSEIAEAFRALAAVLKPEIVEEPLPMTSAEGEPAFYLHQKYKLGSMLEFELRSILIVRTDDTGRIAAMEERWNGAPLLGFAAFRFSRRVNGVLSAILTPVVAR